MYWNWKLCLCYIVERVNINSIGFFFEEINKIIYYYIYGYN